MADADVRQRCDDLVHGRGPSVAKADHPSEASGWPFLDISDLADSADRRKNVQQHGPDRECAGGVIDQALAKKYFPGVNPVGRHMTADLGDGLVNHPMREVVGVVGDVKELGLAMEAVPHYYLPWTQAVITEPYLVLRATGDPAMLERAVKATMAGMDANIPTYRVHPLEFASRRRWHRHASRPCC